MRRLACCSILAGLATLFHCGGASDALIGSAGDGGGSDGSDAVDSGGRPDGTSSGGGDASSSSSSSGGAGEAGGGNEGGNPGEAGVGEGGPGEAGGGEAGPGDAGGEAGPKDGGGGDTGAGDSGPDAGGNDGGGDASGSDGGGDSGAGDGGTDAGGSDGGDGGIVGKAEFRVAALMPIPGSFDFCWQQSGGAWNGPVMAGWGISTRLAYQQVTEYVPVPAAATTVRLVAALATDCNTSLGQVTFTPPAAGSAFLVSSFTQGNVAPQVKAFPDELVAAGAGTRLRAIDAALTTASGGGVIGQPVDFYVAGSVTTVLFDNVAFASTAAAGGSIDADGYLTHDAFAGVDLRVRLHSAADLLDVPGFTTTAGHMYSLFTTGVHNLGGTNPSPMKLVVCDDTAPAVGHLGVCTASGTQL